MEDRRDSRAYRQEYIEGNVVRRTQAVPKYEPQREKTREEILRERSRKRAAKRNQQKAMAMNMGYVCFLLAATLICAGVCALFLSIQSDMTSRMRTISSLESQISEMKADNTAAEKRLETTMNLEEVKKAAKKKGLVYPSSKQIKYYSVENSDYMNQYGDISSN